MGVPAEISAFKTDRKATGEHCSTAYYSYVFRRRRDKYGRFGQGFSIGHAGYASFFDARIHGLYIYVQTSTTVHCNNCYLTSVYSFNKFGGGSVIVGGLYYFIRLPIISGIRAKSYCVIARCPLGSSLFKLPWSFMILRTFTQVFYLRLKKTF